MSDPKLIFASPFLSPQECAHVRTALAVATLRNGAKQYLRQCLDCADKVGTPIARDRALAEARGAAIPKFDEAARDKSWHDMDKRLRAAQAARTTEWWLRYKDYLLTPAWAERRQKVLRRCGGICEGCAEARATQVHHLTYDNVGDELLYQLVGLCEPCHAKAHADDDAEEHSG